jgi:DNA transformation protein
MTIGNPLLELKNIGNTSAHWLNTIGIKSLEDLAAIGPVAAYMRIENKGIKVSKVLLYALQGALLNVHWNDLEPSLKQQLLQELSSQQSNTL